MFGEGEIDFPPILRALVQVGVHGRRVRGTEPPQPRRAGGGTKGVSVSQRSAGYRGKGTLIPANLRSWEQSVKIRGNERSRLVLL